MSERDEASLESRETQELSESALGRLLRDAGRRPEIPSRLDSAIRLSARQSWQEKVEDVSRTRRRRRLWTLAAAATLVLISSWVLKMVLYPAPGSDPAAVVAGVFPASSPLASKLSAGQALPTGRRLVTGPQERVALSLASGVELRMDERSRLVLRSDHSVELLEGALYADSGGGAGGLEILTPYGLARDVGTRFTVRLAGPEVEVQVREGEVELATEDQSYIAAAGTALTLRGGAVERREVSPFGASWAWTLDAAPPFSLEGQNLLAFLRWVSGETGWHLHFADADLEARAATIRTHGQLEGLRPDQALAVVLPSSGLTYRVEDGELWIAP